MNKKSLLAWLMIMIMAMGALAACGPKQEAAPATQEPAATEEAAPAAETAPPAEQAADSAITEDQAKEIALADAGADAASAVFKKSGLEMDDGVQQYEFEFFANDMEYSYDIDAATGNILSREAEAMDAEDYQEMEALQ